MIVAAYLIGQGQVRGVEDPRFRPEEAQQAGRFLHGKSGKGAFAQGAIEQKNARRIVPSWRKPRAWPVQQVAPVQGGEKIRIVKLPKPHACSTLEVGARTSSAAKPVRPSAREAMKAQLP